MKYLLLLAGAERDWSSQEERDYSRIRAWFAEHGRAGRIVAGNELAGSHTATTVRRRDDGRHAVVDGPFAETKESIGGYIVVDVPDLDAAIALAKTWPGLDGKCHGLDRTEAIEIRPIGI